jgi:hypothetical protein
LKKLDFPRKILKKVNQIMKKQEELMKINNLMRIIQIRKRRSEKIVLEIECEKVNSIDVKSGK